MSSIIGRAAFRATPRLRDAGLQAGKSSQSMWKKAVQASDDAGGKAIRQGAKRDPELYVRILPLPAPAIRAVAIAIAIAMSIRIHIKAAITMMKT